MTLTPSTADRIERLVAALETPAGAPITQAIDIAEEVHHDEIVALMTEPPGPLRRFAPGRTRSGPVPSSVG